MAETLDPGLPQTAEKPKPCALLRALNRRRTPRFPTTTFPRLSPAHVRSPRLVVARDAHDPHIILLQFTAHFFQQSPHLHLQCVASRVYASCACSRPLHFQMPESREDSVYLAKLAEQAERYEGAFAFLWRIQSRFDIGLQRWSRT
jgi:hypothetical protein